MEGEREGERVASRPTKEREKERKERRKGRRKKGGGGEGGGGGRRRWWWWWFSHGGLINTLELKVSGVSLEEGGFSCNTPISAHTNSQRPKLTLSLDLCVSARTLRTSSEKLLKILNVIWGGTSGWVFVPCIYSRARWHVPYVTQVFAVVVFVWRLSRAD